jgi:hypothetical protein
LKGNDLKSITKILIVLMFEFELNLNFWCLMPLSALFQLYHGNQF